MLRSGRPTHDRLKGGQRERQRLTQGDAVTASLSCPFVDAALAKHPDRQGADAIKLLLLAGARRSEVLSMRWGDLDLTAGTWNRKAADLKQGRDHSVPPPPALTIQSALRDADRQWEARARRPSAVNTARHLVEVRRLGETW
jgi:integrase